MPRHWPVLLWKYQSHHRLQVAHILRKLFQEVISGLLDIHDYFLHRMLDHQSRLWLSKIQGWMVLDKKVGLYRNLIVLLCLWDSTAENGRYGLLLWVVELYWDGRKSNLSHRSDYWRLSRKNYRFCTNSLCVECSHFSFEVLKADQMLQVAILLGHDDRAGGNGC